MSLQLLACFKLTAVMSRTSCLSSFTRVGKPCTIHLQLQLITCREQFLYLMKSLARELLQELVSKYEEMVAAIRHVPNSPEELEASNKAAQAIKDEMISLDQRAIRYFPL